MLMRLMLMITHSFSSPSLARTMKLFLLRSTWCNWESWKRNLQYFV